VETIRAMVITAWNRYRAANKYAERKASEKRGDTAEATT
jgi:hypothetical protein